MQKCKTHTFLFFLSLQIHLYTPLWPPGIVSTPVLEGPWIKTLGDLNLEMPVMVTEEQR